MNRSEVENDQSREAIRAALLSLEIGGLPPTPEFAPGSEKLKFWFEMAILIGGWGTLVPSQKIISVLYEHGGISNLQAMQLKELGFNGGYRFNSSVEIESPLVQEYQANYAAQLAQGVANARGWDSLDALYIGTSTMTRDAILETADILRKKGIPVHYLQHHNLACQSPTSASVHALQHPDLQNRRVVVVGLDTLTGNLANLYDPVPFTLFGNGGGAWAFIPGVDLMYLGGATYFEHDSLGITQSIPFRDLPPLHERRPLPPNYLLVNSQTADYVAYTDEGLFMAIDPPPSRAITMNGRQTFIHFVKRANTPGLIYEAYQQYEQSPFRDKYGPINKVIGHQPSRAVIDGINHSAQKRFNVQEIPGNPLYFQWVMEETGFNNISAGTSLVALVELASRGLLDAEPTMLVGLGIGNTVGIHKLKALHTL